MTTKAELPISTDLTASLESLSKPVPPMIYLAGPFTSPDPVENTYKAARLGTALWEEMKVLPFTPHLFIGWHTICPRPIEFWYDIDLSYIDKCDAIIRLPGTSPGADAEMVYAAEKGIPEVPFEDLPDEIKAIWLNSPYEKVTRTLEKE